MKTLIDCDILIIGSGAAGGVLAATLSEFTGKSIVLVDKGAHYTSEFFNQREWDMNRLYAERGARSTIDGAIAVRGGECVGGGTTVNFALALDPIPDVWDRWRQQRGLTGFSFDPAASDYGIPGLNMASSLVEVRARLHVERPPDSAVNDNNRVLERGCRALGISTRRFELNMRDCIGCGYCGEGCAYDRKQSTLITYVPDALARGVRLIHHCDIDGLMFERRHGSLIATGARGRIRQTARGSQPNSTPAGEIEIRTPLIILAAGAIETPILLQRSRHPDPNGVLGRGLVLHPGLPIIALMDSPLTNYRGISGTVYSDYFYQSHGFYYETLFGHPVYGSLVLPGIGADHFELMRQYDRIAGFGVMLVDTPNLTNRVEWHAPDATRRIFYQLSDSDRARLRVAAKTGVEILFAAGAREVLLPSTESIGPLTTPRFRTAADATHCSALQFEPYRTTLSSSHCQSTVKMGEDRATSVINSRGESHYVRNLIVCDSSAFPESCGTNPMLSIMTMARYQGRRIAAEPGRYDS
jgi:choline dehydrogenase-like flavoprotein